MRPGEFFDPPERDDHWGLGISVDRHGHVEITWATGVEPSALVILNPDGSVQVRDP